MRGRFNALEVSERDLKTFTAFAMWLTTAVAIIGFSFIPAFAPDDVATWRIALGGPVALLIVLHVVLPSRLSDGALYLGSMISTGLSAIAILALVHATPATMAVLSNCFTAVLFGAYFLERRHMLVLMSMITAVALSTIATNHSLLQPHIDAWLAVFIPTLWVIALTISVQREDLRRALRDSKRKAYTDPLTGLANLRGLRKYAESLMTPEKNGQIRAAGVLLIDLHDFKDANTKYGHLGGDQALRTVAEHLRRAATGDSFVARIGGDEFAVVLRNVTAERLHEYAGLFRGAVLGARAGMKLPGIAIDACVGTAMFPYEGQTLDDLLTVAAKSMYAEKNRRGPTNSVDSDSAEAAEAVGTVERLRWGSADESMTETRGWLRNSKLVHRYLRLPGYAKFAAVAWFAGSASILLSLAITDADHTHETVVLVGGIAGVGTSLLSFWVLPKAGSLHHIFVDGFCLVTVGGAIYLTG
ncbi:MAG TPA: GGDEF domain-containing protein, partial [Solirubrobacterales bacterium]|nr:GGDEF domain-containing protein [Solirubrobacterales bacterium]